MEITLLEFLFRNKERPIDINKITIDDAIYMLKTGVFDEYFDREKVTLRIDGKRILRDRKVS